MKTLFTATKHDFEKGRFGIMECMEKYYCEICGVEKTLTKEQAKRENESAYCYCRPSTPSRLQPVSWKKDQKKYVGIFKSIKSLR